MELWTEAKERKQPVVHRGEVTPEGEQPIPAGRDLLLELILGQRVEEGLDPVGVELPRAKARVDELPFCVHGCVLVRVVRTEMMSGLSSIFMWPITRAFMWRIPDPER